MPVKPLNRGYDPHAGNKTYAEFGQENMTPTFPVKGGPMIGRFISFTVVLIALAAAGCSGVPSAYRGTWHADPQWLEVDNAICKVRITPQKGGKAYFAFFLLSLENKSDAELTVDWNESRYLYGGKAQGMLVFEGVDPKAVKNGTVPLETVAPGSRLTRELMPARLIAWTPIRDNTANARAITPGMLPAGENGVRLSLRQANARVTIPLSVLLTLEAKP